VRRESTTSIRCCDATSARRERSPPQRPFAIIDPMAPQTSRPSYVLALLFLLNVFNFVDRNLLAILLQDVKLELGVSDTAMGFLTGTAFALFYSTAGISIARAADRGSRKLVIILGLAAWSARSNRENLAIPRGFGDLGLANPNRRPRV